MTHFEQQDLAQDTDSSRSGVQKIDRAGVSVTNLEAAQRFYSGALGFRTVGLEVREGEAFAALTGIDGAYAEAAVMRLGDQTLELVQFAKPGNAYPEPRAANDPWFQHFAIAVRDMGQAFTRLSQVAHEPISQGGPQRLPPSTGDVTAYKFRDPDGHPLELSHAPNSHWARSAHKTPGSPTLGIDHSGLVVADLDASVRFYTQGLGLRLMAPALNQGPEQARLDGLDDPVVDIATLKTPAGGPHLELLHYRKPKSLAPPRTVYVNAIATAGLVMHTAHLGTVAERALTAGGTSVSRSVVATSYARKLLLHDPDGHLLELVDPDN